jgi:hypothetical protein
MIVCKWWLLVKTALRDIPCHCDLAKELEAARAALDAANKTIDDFIRDTGAVQTCTDSCLLPKASSEVGCRGGAFDGDGDAQKPLH